MSIPRGRSAGYVLALAGHLEMKKNTILVALLLGSLALCACGGGDRKWGSNEAEVERKDPLVEVVPAVKHNISSFERSTGRVEAHTVAAVYAQVSEVCLEMLHDVGDQVDKDAPLARLDQSRIEIQRRAAELAVNEAELTHARNKLDAEKRKADLERIEKYLDPAKPENARVFTKEAYDAAKLEHEKAINSVGSSELALRKAQGELGAAALQLKHTEIVAPISGVITERNMRANELVSTGSVIFRMADLSVLEVKLDVAEASLSSLHEAPRAPAIRLFGLDDKPDLDQAQAAFLSVTAFPNDRFLGYLDRISPVIDQARGMVVVTVRILQPRDVDEKAHKPLLDKLDPEAKKAVLTTTERTRGNILMPAGWTAATLRPGMWVDARIATQLIKDAVLVPGAAISGDAEIIWKIELDKDNPNVGVATRVDVQGRRGITAEGSFELKPPIKNRPESTEIKAGDLIAVRSQNLLRDRERVRVHDLSK